MSSLTISGSVGKKGENLSKNIKTVQALINVYLRSQAKNPLPVSGINDPALEQAISLFQTKHLKLPKPDSKVDPNGKTLKTLLSVLNGVFKPQAIIAPKYGIITWSAEGTEGGFYHSRKLHIPSPTSGLTLGRGYDFRRKSPATITKNLSAVGMNMVTTMVLKNASGLFGKTAQQFIIDNDLLDFQITPEIQKKLFKISYDDEAAEVQRICAKNDVVKLYGATDWGILNKTIKDIVVDLKFRGDYTPSSRRFLQKSIADNDLTEFKKHILNKDNWKNVPPGRFDRRIKHMNEAQASTAKP